MSHSGWHFYGRFFQIQLHIEEIIVFASSCGVWLSLNNGSTEKWNNYSRLDHKSQMITALATLELVLDKLETLRKQDSFTICVLRVYLFA